MKFQDILVILVFVIIVVPLVIPFLKKIISRESCCGTQLGKTENKKLKKIAGVKTVKIEGMRCKNCEKKVAQIINSIPQYRAKVNLRKKNAKIYYEENFDIEKIAKLLDEAGFSVVSD